ncbi:glucosyltransferase domain-containing protein [Escherichia coli]|uniref:glucosyltransferase domain-containing protein n=1 Tax=Escherichia coli TaxID=562 RepID=UPI001BD601F6|nr:glucosyltransferase domain-containing protein [Escherichia coli]MBS9621019.1 glucosyltransferase domain-containing protein [Escherichia coli]
MLKSYRNYFILGIIFFLPIIIANTYYVDDMGRATYGYSRWGVVDGRPLSDLIMAIINFGKPLTDTQPLLWILCSASIAAGLSLWHKKIDRELTFNSFLVIGVFFANPYLAENFSYRFDSFPMVFGIVLCFLSFIDFNKKNIYKFLLPPFFMLCAMSTYQININLVVLLALCEFVILTNRNNDVYHASINLILRCGQVLLSCIIYMKVILPAFFNGNQGSNHPSVSNEGIVSVIINNFNSYYSFLEKTSILSFKPLSLLSLFIILLMCLNISYRAYKTENTMMKKVACCLVSMSIPLVSVIMVFGSLLILENTIFWATRVYVGVSGYLLLSSICVYYLTKKIPAISILYCAILIVSSVSYFYTYGNALRSQWDYTKTIIQQVFAVSGGDIIKKQPILFYGEPAKTRLLINAENKYQLIRYAVPNYFYNWYWPVKAFELNGISVSYAGSDPLKKEILKINFCNNAEVKHSQNFDIVNVNGLFIIDFSKKCN